MSGRFSETTVRDPRGHPIARGDEHAFCATCRESGIGDDPCSLQEPCPICDIMPEEIKRSLAERQRYKRKGRGGKAHSSSSGPGHSNKPGGDPGRLQYPGKGKKTPGLPLKARHSAGIKHKSFKPGDQSNPISATIAEKTVASETEVYNPAPGFETASVFSDRDPVVTNTSKPVRGASVFSDVESVNPITRSPGGASGYEVSSDSETKGSMRSRSRKRPRISKRVRSPPPQRGENTNQIDPSFINGVKRAMDSGMDPMKAVRVIRAIAPNPVQYLLPRETGSADPVFLAGINQFMDAGLDPEMAVSVMQCLIPSTPGEPSSRASTLISVGDNHLSILASDAASFARSRSPSPAQSDEQPSTGGEEEEEAPREELQEAFREEVMDNKLPPTDFSVRDLPPVRYPEVIGIIQDQMNLAQVAPQTRPKHTMATVATLPKKAKATLPLSVGIKTAARAFDAAVGNIPPVRIDQLRDVRNRVLPPLPPSVASELPMERGALSKDIAHIDPMWDQLRRGKPEALPITVLPKTIKAWEVLSREQTITCSHLDFQVATLQKLNEQLLQKCGEDPNTLVLLNKSKALINALANSNASLNEITSFQLGYSTLVRRDALLARSANSLPAENVLNLRQSPILGDDLFDPLALKAAASRVTELAQRSYEFHQLNLSPRSKYPDVKPKQPQKLNQTLKRPAQSVQNNFNNQGPPPPKKWFGKNKNGKGKGRGRGKGRGTNGQVNQHQGFRPGQFPKTHQ